MSKYWIDTEFIEDGTTIDLISIGIVCSDNREYYAISREFDPHKASDWVIENVIKQLPDIFSGKPLPPECKTRQQIKDDILSFCSPMLYGKPEFWAYYADYDWVAFCQLFGTMMDLPKDFPMYCLDIKQECDRLGNPDLPVQDKGLHNALEDAKWNRKAWEFLATLGGSVNGS